ncbi:MAG: RibD family protein [bacterium]|nr:RibD family protein [bacterium]
MPIDTNLKPTSKRSQSIKSYNERTSLPYIRLSFGMSLDGKIATYTGDSKYISGPESRQFVHRLRHNSDAILVGINTILIDHPSLTTRLTNQVGKDAHRIILDSTCRIDPYEPLLLQTSNARTIVVTKLNSHPQKISALRKQGILVLEIECTSSTLPLLEVLSQLYQMGIRSILVEGGSTVHFSFIRDHLFQELYATISPLIIGGEQAKGAVGGQGFQTLNESMKLHIKSIKHVGKDYIIHAIPDIKGE